MATIQKELSEKDEIFFHLVKLAKRPLKWQRIFPSSVDGQVPIFLSYALNRQRGQEEVLIDFKAHQLSLRRCVYTSKLRFLIENRGVPDLDFHNRLSNDGYLEITASLLQTFYKVFKAFHWSMYPKYWINCLKRSLK